MIDEGFLIVLHFVEFKVSVETWESHAWSIGTCRLSCRLHGVLSADLLDLGAS